MILSKASKEMDEIYCFVISILGKAGQIFGGNVDDSEEILESNLT